MPKRALTAAAVDRLKPPAKGQTEYFDRGYPGFALRVSYGGGKAWGMFYRHAGKLRRLTLGLYPAMSLADAREAWRETRKLVAMGQDPAQRTAAGQAQGQGLVPIPDAQRHEPRRPAGMEWAPD